MNSPNKIVNENNTGRATIVGDKPIPGIEIGMRVKYKPVNSDKDGPILEGVVQDILLSYTDEYLDVYYVINNKWICINEIREYL